MFKGVMFRVTVVAFQRREAKSDWELGVAVIPGADSAVTEDTVFMDSEGKVVEDPLYNYRLAPHHGAFVVADRG